MKRCLRTGATILLACAVGAGSARAAALDSPPPLSISPPADITTTATTPCISTYCAFVSFSFSVSGGVPPYNLVCNFTSGSEFTVGSHTVSCFAQDSVGDSSPPASFTVTVEPPPPGTPPPPGPPPPAPPLSISPPADITTTATTPCISTYCAFVNYSFTVSGGYPPYSLSCELATGGEFTVGSHTVSCIAVDSRDDSTPPASFTVTVEPPDSAGGTSNGGGSATTAGGTGGGSSSNNGSAGGTSTSGSGNPTPASTPPPTPAAPHVVIDAPASITLSRNAIRVISITSNVRDVRERLCWRSASGEACTYGRGTWRVKIHATAGRETFELRRSGKVVARKTVVVKVKA